jgi:glycosyltransferase involved in cell wall biosynthesis
MRIVLYSKVVRKVSGLQTFEKIFCKKLSKHFDLTFVYESTHNERFIKEIEQYCKVVKLQGQTIDADICIYSSLQHGIKIQAKKNYQIIHSNLKAWNVKYEKPEYINNLIAVSETVARTLKEDMDLESITIENMLDEPKLEKVLRLITASRIETGKGFERVIDISKALRQAGKRFTWEIYGDGSLHYINELKYKLTGIHEVQFMSYHNSIQSYMATGDYVVQLSDDEGFCYSVYEALQIGKPVIVTNWPGIEKVVKNGENGYILNMDLSNLDVEKLYEIPQNVRLDVIDNISHWINLFNQ